jgi:hypothetical protein
MLSVFCGNQKSIHRYIFVVWFNIYYQMDFRLTHPNTVCQLRNIAIFFLIQVGIGTVIFGSSLIIISGYYYYFSILILIALTSTLLVTVLAHFGYVDIDGQETEFW